MAPTKRSAVREFAYRDWSQVSCVKYLRKNFVQKPPSTPLLAFLESHKDLKSLRVEETCPYFNGRFSFFQRGKGNEELVKLVVEIGKRARMNDAAFCEAMNPVGEQPENLPSYNVIHGECSLMKLTDAFKFGKQDFCSFIKFSGFDEVYQSLVIPSPETSTARANNKLLKLTGPSGMGKSFLLQYLVRKMRVMPHVCVLYLANPELFLRTGRIMFEPVLMELLYSVCHCLDDDLIAWFTATLAKMNRQYDQIEQFELLRQAFLRVIESLRIQKKNLILVVDQEEVYHRYSRDSPDSVGEKFHEFLLHGCFGTAYVLSSRSYTSKRVEDSPNSKRFVKMLSDAEILAALNARCRPGERYHLSCDAIKDDGYARAAIDMVVMFVGRCPRDIHRLLNTEVQVKTPPSGTEMVQVKSSRRAIADTPGATNTETASGANNVSKEATKASSSVVSQVPLSELYELMFPTIDAQCTYVSSGRTDVIKRHESFFQSLSRQEQDAFLLMLTIADKSPAIGKDGLYVYDTLPSKPLDATSKHNTRGYDSEEEHIRSLEDYISMIGMDTAEERTESPLNSLLSALQNELSRIRSKDKNIGLVKISSFLKVEGFEEYENIGWASNILDGRYFFIGKDKYIRPVSELAFRAIKDYHYNKHQSRFEALLDQVGDKNKFSDPIFQFLFFIKFSDPQSAFVLQLSTASSSNYVFSELSIPICAHLETPLDFKRILESGHSVMLKCLPGFPLIDFCIICPNDALSDAQDFNMLKSFPWIDDGLKVNFQFRKKATLILGRIGVKCIDNETGALKIAFDAGLAPNGKRLKAISGTGSEEGTLKGYQELKNFVRSFVQTSVDLYYQPYVHFLWITKTADALDTCHSQTIVCCDPSVVKKSPSEVKQMDITSKKSPKA